MVATDILLLSLLAIGAQAEFDSPLSKSIRVVGGGEAQKNTYDFAASLSTNEGSHFCGGSLIRPNWVLTAAHCMNGLTNFKVTVGRHDLKSNAGKTHGVKAIFTHPSYNSKTMVNDIALVELSSSSSITPVDLDASDKAVTHVGKTATIVGWGALREGGQDLPSRLQEVSLPVVTKAECNKGYAGDIVDSMLCAGFTAGGKDSCQGDSGGPLFIGTKGSFSQIGVVSWGEGCARKDRYGVYTRVSHFAEFVKQVTSGAAASDPPPGPCVCDGGTEWGQTCGDWGLNNGDWCYVTKPNCKESMQGPSGNWLAWTPCSGGGGDASSPPAGGGDDLDPPNPPTPPSGGGANDGENCPTACLNDGQWGSSCANPDNDPSGPWCMVAEGGENCPIFVQCKPGGDNDIPTPPPSTTTTPCGDNDTPTAPPSTAAPQPVGPTDEVLLSEDFLNKSLTLEEMGWSVIDAGDKQAPSKWSIDHAAQAVKQSQNVRTAESHKKYKKLGTRLVYKPNEVEKAWGSDYSFGVQLSSEDNDMLGVFVRYIDTKNFLRFSVDHQERKAGGPYSRLVQFVNGVPELLASGSFRYTKGKWHEVETIVVGNLARVLVDGAIVLETTDVKTPVGPSTVGLYSFANRGSAFSSLRLTKRESLQSNKDAVDPLVPVPLDYLVGSYAPKDRVAKSSARLTLALAEPVNAAEDVQEIALDGEENDNVGAASNDKDNGVDTTTLVGLICGGVAVAVAALAIGAAVSVHRRKPKRAMMAKDEEAIVVSGPSGNYVV